MDPYLAIDAVSVAYGNTTVLHGVDLGVARGELCALLGSSGCGKTTLLRSIAGFVTPSAGAIRVEGRDILGLPPEKRGTAMMFQSYALWPHMSVADNIGYGLRMRGARKPEIARRVEEMLDLLQLGGTELLFFESRYTIPIKSLTVPFVGAPLVTLRHVMGSAGINTLPSLDQEIGMGLGLGPLRLEVSHDVSQNGGTKFGIGISFVREQ